MDPAVVELARPLLRDALVAEAPGLLWISLDWEAPLARLQFRRLAEGPLPGAVLRPGLARSHRVVTDLFLLAGTDEGVVIELGVARAPEGDLDPGPAEVALLPASSPLALAGLLAAGHQSGVSPQEAAARAGATYAVRRMGELAPAPEAVAVAAAVMAAESELGGDFHLVSSDHERAVLANHRCPFGPEPPPGLCRFTSALAGTVAARAVGSAEVSLDERLALGDAQCRLVIDLRPGAPRSTSHRYSWPPAGLAAPEEPTQSAGARGFRVTLSLQLPRDLLSVPVTRHLVRAAMQEVGVIAEDAESVELAVTEACANVIDHSGPGDAYDVAVTVGPSACHIRVVDIGRGFDHHALSPPDMADLDAEHGRGVALMHALVDQVRFESEPEHGTVVHLVKWLRFDDEVPARRLMLQSLSGPKDPA